MHILLRSCVLFLSALLSIWILPTATYAAEEAKESDSVAISQRQKNFTVYDEKINNDPAMRSEFIVRMFINGCFRHFFEQDQLIAWANDYLTEIPEEQGGEFLPLVGAKNGRVWTANIAGGTQPLQNNRVVGGGEIVMVVEDAGACHVLGYGTDEDAVHSELKAFAAERVKDMKDMSVQYKYTPKGREMQHNRSDIVIRWPDNKSMAYAFASTVPGDRLQDHTVSITMNANFRYTE